MSSSMQSVGEALDGVAAWQAEQAAKRLAEVADVDRKIAELQRALAELQVQITSLGELKAELAEGVDDPSQGVARAYDAIFAALVTQLAAASERSELALASRQARYDAVLARLATSEVAARVTEFEQFKTQVEGTLAGLPASYRSAIMAHHQGVSDQIRGWLARQLEGEVEVAAPLLTLDVVYGVDAPEGKPEMLICVLPIPDVAFSEWMDRPEDLCTRIGARVVQAIYETTRQTGPAGAQAVCGGHQGMLAIEVDLEGARADFATVLADTLTAVLQSAPDLAAARVALAPRAVDVDTLLPPEAGEES